MDSLHFIKNLVQLKLGVLLTLAKSIKVELASVRLLVVLVKAPVEIALGCSANISSLDLRYSALSLLRECLRCGFGSCSRCCFIGRAAKGVHNTMYCFAANRATSTHSHTLSNHATKATHHSATRGRSSLHRRGSILRLGSRRWSLGCWGRRSCRSSGRGRGRSRLPSTRSRGSFTSEKSATASGRT